MKSHLAALGLFTVLVACHEENSEASPLVLSKNNLVPLGNKYVVRGELRNPNSRAAQDVEIRFSVTPGSAQGAPVRLKNVPANGSTEFFAANDELPDIENHPEVIHPPLHAEIKAQWAK